jgi:hypothetical protein
VALNDFDGTADGGGVGQRGAAELVHVRCAALSWGHRFVRITRGRVGS